MTLEPFPIVYQGWADQGIAVIAHDSQGFGQSKGDDPKLHAWVDDFQHWVDDVYQIHKVCLQAWLCIALIIWALAMSPCHDFVMFFTSCQVLWQSHDVFIVNIALHPLNWGMDSKF